MDQFLVKPPGGKAALAEESAAAAIVTASAANTKSSIQLNEANRTIFGNLNFRPRQLEIVQAVMRGEDVFVVMPTGGGKSLCYALPAILSQGVTVVISPLISLIEDQVTSFLQLPSGGIPSAYLTGNCNESQIRAVDTDLKRAFEGKEPFLKLLYITPEKMVRSREVRDLLLALDANEMLARFAIDECHCVSSWGHDFRKEYGMLNILKEDYPLVPIVALTATARAKVAADTIRILRIPNCSTFSLGYDRPNLFFEVREKSKKTTDVLPSMLRYVLTQGPQSTGIVYCFSKKDCEKAAAFLVANGVKADFYHAGQTKTDRKIVQSAWLKGDVKVVCATIAYGMGIDKPDVRYVLHLSLAKSLEGYYQEAGRAGRDGLRSECVVLYKPADASKLAMLMTKPPARKLSKKDRDMLEEMQEYCEGKGACRRFQFHEKFGSAGTPFKRCVNMCDNCRGPIENQMNTSSGTHHHNNKDKDNGNSSSRSGGNQISSGITFVDKSSHSDWIATASSYGDKGNDYGRDGNKNRDGDGGSNRAGLNYDDIQIYGDDDFKGNSGDHNGYKPVSVITSDRSMFQRASSLVRAGGGTGHTKPQTGVRTYFSSVTDGGGVKTVQRSGAEDSRMQRHDTANRVPASSSSEIAEHSSKRMRSSD